MTELPKGFTAVEEITAVLTVETDADGLFPTTTTTQRVTVVAVGTYGRGTVLIRMEEQAGTPLHSALVEWLTFPLSSLPAANALWGTGAS